jgi:hypothetical protein
MCVSNSIVFFLVSELRKIVHEILVAFFVFTYGEEGTTTLVFLIF